MLLPYILCEVVVLCLGFPGVDPAWMFCSKWSWCGTAFAGRSVCIRSWFSMNGLIKPMSVKFISMPQLGGSLSEVRFYIWLSFTNLWTAPLAFIISWGLDLSMVDQVSLTPGSVVILPFTISHDISPYIWTCCKNGWKEHSLGISATEEHKRTFGWLAEKKSLTVSILSGIVYSWGGFCSKAIKPLSSMSEKNDVLNDPNVCQKTPALDLLWLFGTFCFETFMLFVHFMSTQL